MSAKNKNIPRVFLTYANPDNDLTNLAKEQKSVGGVFEQNHDAGNLLVLETPHVEAVEIRHTFNKPCHKGNIVLWHFGGHGGAYHLLLHNGRVGSNGLEQFLRLQKGLHLVFLNGCSTLGQAKKLVEKIPVVIATSGDVDDEVAYLFAAEFYQAINNFETIGAAFKLAETRILMDYGDYQNDRKSLQSILKRGSKKIVTTPDVAFTPWHLLRRDEADIHWTLQQAIGNPYLGLPEPLLNPGDPELPGDPFVSLQPYTHKEAKIFFGRGWEIRQLYQRIKNEKGASVLALMGQSGVGKSSLLSAGLLPRLMHGYKVACFRRDAGKGILDAFYQVFPDLGNLSGEELLNCWKGYEEAEKPIVLILDQLEEIFTKPLKDNNGKELSPFDELNALLEIIKALFLDARNKPKGKIILSYRKEYSPETEAQIKEYAIDYEPFLLFPFRENNLKEVITGIQTREKYQIVYDEKLPQLMMDDLLEDMSSPVAPMLQILLAKMWEATVAQNTLPRKFTRDLYGQMKKEGLLLRDFLNQQLAKVARQEVFAACETSGLVLDLLHFHTTALGTANTRTRKDIMQRYTHLQNAGDWEKLIGLLVELRLLAEQGDKNELSLGHDILAPLVIEAYHESDKPGQRATQILESKLKNKVANPYSQLPSLGKSIIQKLAWLVRGRVEEHISIYLDKPELKIVKQGIAGMRKLNPDEKDLIRRTEENNKSEARGRGAVIFFFVGVTMLVYFLAGDNAKKDQTIKERTRRAQKAEDRAEVAKQRAKEEQGKANEAKKAAQEAQDSLGIAKSEAQLAQQKANQAKLEAQAQNLAAAANQQRSEQRYLEALRLARYAYQSTVNNPSPLVTNAFVHSFYAWAGKQLPGNPIWAGLLLPGWSATKNIPVYQQFYYQLLQGGRELKIENFRQGTFKTIQAGRPTTSLVYLPKTNQVVCTIHYGTVFIGDQPLPGILAQKLLVSPQGSRLVALGMAGKKLYIIDALSKKTVAKTSLKNTITALAFWDENTLLAASGNKVHQYTMGQTPQPLFKASFQVHKVLGSSRQNYVLVANPYANKMEIYTRQGALVLSSPHKALGLAKVVFNWSKTAFSKDEQEMYVEIKDTQGKTKVLTLPLPARISQLLQKHPETQLTTGDRKKYGIK